MSLCKTLIYIAPKKPRNTSAQKRTRVDWFYEHLS